MNTEIVKITSLDGEAKDNIAKAAKILNDGGLVVFPTETVYGLGADATNGTAVASVFSAKGRPSDNPLIIHLSTPSDAVKYAYVGKEYEIIAQKFMPGPITVVLPKRDIIPDSVTGGLSTVAVRVPSNEIARTLISLAQIPVAAPSANISGEPSGTNLQNTKQYFKDNADFYIDGGECEIGLSSTIVQVIDGKPQILRQGSITLEQINQVL